MSKNHVRVCIHCDTGALKNTATPFQRELVAQQLGRTSESENRMTTNKDIIIKLQSSPGLLILSGVKDAVNRMTEGYRFTIGDLL